MKRETVRPLGYFCLSADPQTVKRGGEGGGAEQPGDWKDIYSGDTHTHTHTWPSVYTPPLPQQRYVGPCPPCSDRCRRWWCQFHRSAAAHTGWWPPERCLWHRHRGEMSSQWFKNNIQFPLFMNLEVQGQWEWNDENTVWHKDIFIIKW